MTQTLLLFGEELGAGTASGKNFVAGLVDTFLRSKAQGKFLICVSCCSRSVSAPQAKFLSTMFVSDK